MINIGGILKIRDNFYNNLAKKVRLNGNIITTNLELEKTSSGVLVTFEVPEGVSNVSNLELMDEDNVVISSNQFYVNVVPNTFFKYQINFKGE